MPLALKSQNGEQNAYLVPGRRYRRSRPHKSFRRPTHIAHVHSSCLGSTDPQIWFCPAPTSPSQSRAVNRWTIPLRRSILLSRWMCHVRSPCRSAIDPSRHFHWPGSFDRGPPSDRWQTSLGT